jgi:hypothetical protein
MLHFRYKKAWKIALDKTPDNIKSGIKKLKNYDAKVFYEITGSTWQRLGLWRGLDLWQGSGLWQGL